MSIEKHLRCNKSEQTSSQNSESTAHLTEGSDAPLNLAKDGTEQESWQDKQLVPSQSDSIDLKQPKHSESTAHLSVSSSTPPLLVEGGAGQESWQDKQLVPSQSDVIDSKQPKLKVFKCKECPKTYKNKNSLVLHQKIHTGENLFQCERCDK